MNTSMPGQSNVMNHSDVHGTPGEAIAKRIDDFVPHVVNATRAAVLAAGGSEEAATAACDAAVKAYAVMVTSASFLIGDPYGDFRYGGSSSIAHSLPYARTAVEFAIESFKTSGVDDATAHRAAARRATIAVENLGAPLQERLAIVAAAVAGAAAATKTVASSGASAPKKEGK